MQPQHLGGRKSRISSSRSLSATEQVRGLHGITRDSGEEVRKEGKREEGRRKERQKTDFFSHFH